jgi:MoaA/NifB/PqqE/SkfB family radical SAM enzyme
MKYIHRQKRTSTVLWYLTRKCNLRCSYCNIIKNSECYNNSTLRKEIPIDLAIESLERFKKHNPHAFHIFMGGEPTLYTHLEELINFCNEEKILYAIVSNMTDIAYKKLLTLVNRGIQINSITGTVDVCLFDKNADKKDDRYKKSKLALERLHTFSQMLNVKEVVAEVCITRNDYHLLETLLEELTKRKIYADIFPIETRYNKYYDFTAPVDHDLLLPYDKDTIRTLERIYKRSKRGELLIIGDEVIKYMINYLPQNYICRIPETFSTMTIDSDGKVRLCMRIKGTRCEELGLTVPDILSKRGTYKKKISNKLSKAMILDRQNYCRGCMWTCAMFSDLEQQGLIDFNTVSHEK